VGSNPTFPRRSVGRVTHRFRRGPLTGEIRVAGDKSISHRALMFAALAPGRSTISALNRGADVLATRDAIAALGAGIDDRGEAIVIDGGRLHDPLATIDARNSGTTTRLLAGLCAGQGIAARFDGDASLRRRPMERVARPLRALGAQVTTTGGRLPLSVEGATTDAGGEIRLEIASAQVKSAILLANLRARATVRVTGDAFTRDHTERLLRRFGRDVTFDGRTIEVEPGTLVPCDVRIPADLSGAAFFLAGGAIAPGSDVVLREVGTNPTRTGVLEALVAMGADVALERERELDGEPVADIRVRYRQLRATTLDGDLVVRAIDEVPILAIVAAYAEGTTHIRGAGDLRAKESDRLAAVTQTLRACGVAVEEFDDGLDITGGRVRAPERVLAAFDDHRIAMAVAALAAPTADMDVDDVACVAVSFPGFVELWDGAQRNAVVR